MSKNLELWQKVEVTNPAYTKKANVKGNQITSIAPQYQIKQATEQFGSYGSKWGFKSMDFDYTLREIGMIVFKAVFYFPGGEFPIVNSVQLFKDNAQTKIDDDFAKKVETDTLTKALSKLGFSADIFLGKFDDIKYFEATNKEFGILTQNRKNYILNDLKDCKEVKLTPQEKKDKDIKYAILLQEALASIQKCVTLKELETTFKALPTHVQADNFIIEKCKTVKKQIK